ncbi:MAG: hypothetical protein ACK4N5_07585 [Myxococcales bacterium]
MLRKLLISLSCAGALLLSACGPTCADVCARIGECTRAGTGASQFDTATCVRECDQDGACGASVTDAAKEQAAMNCFANMDCAEDVALQNLLGCAGSCL